MTNHGGKIDKSTRLDRMFQTLAEFGTASTLQLQKMTGDMAPATTMKQSDPPQRLALARDAKAEDGTQ